MFNSFTASQIAEQIGGKLHGDPNVLVRRIMPLETAVEGDLTFYAPKNRKKTSALGELLRQSKASAVLLLAPQSDLPMTQISVSQPLLAVAKLAEIFRPAPAVHNGVHPLASVSRTAKLGSRVSIGAFAVVGNDVQIADGSIIHPHVVIYDGAVIGRNCVIHAGAIIRENVVLGDDCLIQNGVVLGGDGFGYMPDKEIGHRRIPHIGAVELGRGVDIGANTTIDRGMLDSTRVGDNSKIDNLCMVGHNTQIGKRAIVCGHVGISGSCNIGDDVVLAGNAGVADHITIGDRVRAAAKAGITHSVPPDTDVAGHPWTEAQRWRRQSAAISQLPELIRKVRRLSGAVAAENAPSEDTDNEDHQ